MERQIHKGSFILVEGETDELRIGKFIDKCSCSIIIAFGKSNIIQAIELLLDDGIPGCLGMMDADFDRVSGALPDDEGIILSQHHDFDLDVICSPALTRYLKEVADEAKLKAFGGSDGVLKYVAESIRALSAARWANQREKLKYRLKDMNVANFYDDAAINKAALIDEIFAGRNPSAEARDKLSALIDKYAKLNVDILQITCGHDFCAALGIALRNQLGSRLGPQSWRSEVELHLRLTYDRADFENSPTFAAIKSWEAENEPYQVLLN